MSKKKVVSRRELLERWRAIEDEEDDDHHSNNLPDNRQRLNLKEDWFSDAFNFLISLPKENHIWCHSWDLMGPLLETFYNYFKDEQQDSPLKLLWKRISEELQQCMRCICQHHQAIEMYNMEYDSSSIGPLLDVLSTLDEERVTNHLKEINANITKGEFDQETDNAKIVSVMYEVLMFPILLDDQYLVSEFQIFIEAIDDSHELTLADHQQYPGVYALLFVKSRRTRSIGFRLAAHMGKLRRATDLEPLHPLLKKCIDLLETEELPSTTERSRPRMQLDRITVWLGIKALLGFLEPPTFEEGILERHPNFLNIVLNHICDDSPDFSYAVNCLRLLFEMLGCKLWLRSALSPSVMRDTLLGQCFHTQNEKSHKDIFDLFQPFVQSLEALQDGEHEKQRRGFLYFLLHQVTVSSNFSNLMRKKACQIALRIVHRGYKMNPSCPPFECAHMWGPSLVSSLKDSSLHSSLRQPAFDLIETIIVSDAASIVTSVLNYRMSETADGSMHTVFKDEDDEELFLAQDGEQNISCWNDFNVQNQVSSREYEWWMCIPMLWFEVLVEIDPSALPLSFSKAAFWALSRFSMVEPQASTEMSLPVRNWLSTFAPDILHLFGWKIPSGSDDGRVGKESKNSVKVSTTCISLVRTFKRLMGHFVERMEQGKLLKHWTWEPRMSESLILSLVDPDDNARQVGRRILEQVSNTRGLLCGLQFLCSSAASLSAIFVGIRHALKLVQLDSVLLQFRSLHHFFFVLNKLLKEGVKPTESLPQSSSDDTTSDIKFSSQGGFLRQPVFDSLAYSNDNLLKVDPTYWEKFSFLISEIAWPSFCKCFSAGKAFIDDKTSQMTCIRLLEILPAVLQKLGPSIYKKSESLVIVVESHMDFKWLYDIMDWGKSSLAVVLRYWKQAVLFLLNLLKETCGDNSTSAIRAMEKLILRDDLAMDELTEQVSHLRVSLMNETSHRVQKTRGFSHKVNSLAQDPDANSLVDAEAQILRSTNSVKEERDTVIVLSDDETDIKNLIDDVTTYSPGLSQLMLDGEAVGSGSSERAQDPDANSLVDAEAQILHSTNSVKEERDTVIVLSDDETDIKNLIDDVTTYSPGLSQLMLDGEAVGSGSSERGLDGKVTKNDVLVSKALNQTDDPNSAVFVHPEVDSDRNSVRCEVPTAVIQKSLNGLRKQNSFPSQRKPSLKNLEEGISTQTVVSLPSHRASHLKKVSDATAASKNMENKSAHKVLGTSDMVLKELVWDAEADPWEFALKSARRQQTHLLKPNTDGPKRQVIQLNLPAENRFSNRLDGGYQRFKPPRLDDWYRPILEMDYFAAVGLAHVGALENPTARKLKEVPVCFKSPDDYVAIFRPLVLEEFNAQLHSSYAEMVSSEEMSCGSLSVLSVERVDDFHVVRFVHDDTDIVGSKICSENDLILLTRQPFRNSSHDVHMVGKVERREKDNRRRSSILVIRFYLQNGCSRLNRARKLLLERSKWYISHLMTITPQLREFQALSSINNIPLLPTILNPSNRLLGRAEPKKDLSRLSSPLQQILKSSYNDSQFQAVSAAAGSVNVRKDYELSLIQGPPGTGKTRTIVAIISVLLAFSGSSGGKRPSNDDPKTRCNPLPNTKRMSQSAAIARAWQDAALARQLNEEEQKNGNSRGSHTTRRVLICAQSNAAVDELVSRISSNGLYGSDGIMYKPYLVRVGNAKTVHPNSLPFFIDTLVDHRLAEEKINYVKNDINGDSSAVIRSKLEKLVDRIRFYEAKRANLRNENPDLICSAEENDPEGDDVNGMSDAEIGAKLRKLYGDKKAVYNDLAIAQAREKKASEESKNAKYKLRKSILKEAEIVVTTLSGCGGDLYGVCSESFSSHKFNSSSEYTLFDAVVIDEAAQALEPATLIPLQLLKSKGSRCIMVGDPKQLPATVLSTVASKYLYQCSMFERLQKAGHPVTMLAEQYRMHPEISRFPSLHFYEKKLLNGGQTSDKEASFHKTAALGPYVFFDIVDGQELRGKNSGSLSLYNECEADAAVELLRVFNKSYPSEFVGGRIGIITPYKSQLSLLRSRFSCAFGSWVTDEIEFNTVDGYQGREVDILILSTVRAAEPFSGVSTSKSSSIGFVADVRRMNVALTRAKLSLWILGNARTLQTNENWGALVKDAEERKLIISVKKPYASLFNLHIHQNQVSESYHGNSRQLRDLKMEEVSRNMPHKSYGRKRSHTGMHDIHFEGGAEHTSLTTKEYDKAKKKAKHQPGLLAKKHHESVVENSVKRIVKDVKSRSSVDRITYDESCRTGSGKRQLNNGNTDVGATKGFQERSNILDRSGQALSSSTPLKLVSGKDSAPPCTNDSSGNMDIDKSSGSKFQADGAGRSSNQLGKPIGIVSKRKQQRDAVDALLSSALISSKNSESSSKSVPVKKLTNSSGHTVRPPKPRKGKDG